MATCKYCGKPITNDENGFCELPGDPCWHAWMKQQDELDKQGFSVRCDETNNSPEDIAQGKVIVDVLMEPPHPFGLAVRATELVAKYRDREEEIVAKWASYLEGVEDQSKRFILACLMDSQREQLEGLSVKEALDRVFGEESEP